MIESFKTVYAGGTTEIIVNKSKFIATVFPVKTEEDAISFIEDTKKKYKDANHNCYAYVIGKNDEIRRCSDDGEPSKTAGVPILDVLLLEKIHNTAIVVTRYFGGVLLGTGGLVRAYQGAAKEGLNSSIIIDKLYGEQLKVVTDYNGIGKLQYIIASLNITTRNTTYTDIVTIELLAPWLIMDQFKKEAMEATSGKAIFTPLDPVFYATIDGNVVVFDNES